MGSQSAPPKATHGPREPRWIRRLHLPAYGISRAATMIGMEPDTLGRWFLPRRGVRGKCIEPPLTRRRPGMGLSYLDLIEAVVAAGLRADAVPLDHIRTAHKHLRKTFGVSHPFARLELERRGRHILYRLAERHGGEWGVVTAEASSDGQIIWREPVEGDIEPVWRPKVAERIQQLEYDERLRVSVRWYPRGKDFPVVVDPRVAFGAPALAASRVPTWVIRDRTDAGESCRSIASDFEISEEEVRWALDFEAALRSRKAA